MISFQFGNFSALFLILLFSNKIIEYHVNPIENDYFRGIIWELWRGDYSLRKSASFKLKSKTKIVFNFFLFKGAVELKIRPHDFPRMLPQVTTTTTVTPLPPYLGPDDIIPEDP